MAAKPRKRPAKKKGGRKKAAKKKAPAKAKPRSKRKLPPQLEANKWKPGQSGNPKGRPKRKSLEEVLREYLAKVLETDKEGNEVTRLDAMAKVVFSEGVTKRNAKVMIALMDRLWPKPIRLQGDPDNPLHIVQREPNLDHMSDKDLRQMDRLNEKALRGGR